MTSFPPPSELLPHAGRAVLLDQILSNSSHTIRARVSITPEHPFFVADHGVPAWVGIEMMAQAIAAHAGLNGMRDGSGPRSGMLLGTRRYEARAPWFAPGASIDIRATTTFDHEGGIAACDCLIEDTRGILAEATIIIIEGEIA